MSHKKLKVLAISDGTGKTAQDVLRAVSLQFPEHVIEIDNKPNIREASQLKKALLEAHIHYHLIVYTLVDKKLREIILSDKGPVQKLDLLGPALSFFGSHLNSEPNYEAGLSRNLVDENYYQKIAALEFTLNHDEESIDNIEALKNADIVLIGISRTSKTPLSVFLSLSGLKVITYKVSKGQDLPSEITEIDQNKIIALTIEAEALKNIRQNRLESQNQVISVEYDNLDEISEEITWAKNLYKSNPIWPVFNVTNKSLEEVSSEIIKFMQMRLLSKKKQSARFQK